MSSTTNPGDRSAAEIEREVEATRARLTGTVDELRERVSPNQLADQAMDWLRGSGGKEFLGNLGGTVRDNPLPVLLVAAGIGWLAMSGGRSNGSSHSRSSSRDYRYAPPVEGGEGYPGGSYAGAAYGGSGSYPGESYPAETYAGEYGASGASGGPSLTERAGDMASGLSERAGQTASDLRNQAAGLAGRAGDAASGAWNSATGTAQSLADTASQAGQRVAQRAGQAWSSAAGSASDIANRASGYGNQAGQRIIGAVEQQPLLLGALGVALGAALGALLPSSEAEDRLMGESRDRLAGQAAELAGDAWNKARDAAQEHLGRAEEHLGEAYGKTRERMAEGGLDPQAGAQALGEVARDLRQAVERTVHEVAGSARAAGEGQARPQG